MSFILQTMYYGYEYIYNSEYIILIIYILLYENNERGAVGKFITVR